MTDPNFIILYVDSAPASAAFYGDLLARPPVQSGPDFALFILAGGLKLGLWSRHAAQPAAQAAGGGGELCFPQDDDAAVDAVHADWSARGLPIAQAPGELVFGYTFVALDPDGHRLRAFHLKG